MALIFLPEQKTIGESVFTRLTQRMLKDADEAWVSQIAMDMLAMAMSKVGRTEDIRTLSCLSGDVKEHMLVIQVGCGGGRLA